MTTTNLFLALLVATLPQLGANETVDARVVALDFTHELYEQLSPKGATPLLGGHFCVNSNGDDNVHSQPGKNTNVLLTTKTEIAERGAAVALTLSVRVEEDGGDRTTFDCFARIIIRPALALGERIRSVDSRGWWPIGKAFRGHGELHYWWEQADWLAGYTRNPGTYLKKVQFQTDAPRSGLWTTGFGGVAEIKIEVSRDRDEPKGPNRYEIKLCDPSISILGYDKSLPNRLCGK